MPLETRFQLDCLKAMKDLSENGEKSHGLGIQDRLNKKYDSEINHGRLYPNLDKLIERGLVEKSELDKRTNEYTLTDEGRETLNARIVEMGGKVPEEASA